MQVSINNVNIDQTCNRYFLTNVKQSILSIDTECSNHDQLVALWLRGFSILSMFIVKKVHVWKIQRFLWYLNAKTLQNER